LLKFDSEWRFESPGEISTGFFREAQQQIGIIAGQAQMERQRIFEHFKAFFAGAAGSTASWSSSASWAQTDMNATMEEAAKNAPLFIEAYLGACEALREKHPHYAIPDVAQINRSLSTHQTGYQIVGDTLQSTNPHVAIPVPLPVKSLDDEAQAVITESLQKAEQLLLQGDYRQAVQESLWLLETVSTAFQGMNTGSGTVEGKYFNRIAADLQKHSKGTALDRVLEWIKTLHGFLSSPTGGGVRHGTKLSAAVKIDREEARLYCNLIRSYITFLMAEHDRLKRARVIPTNGPGDNS